MKKLLIVITHPIQYYVPVFQLLAKSCDLKVLYTWEEKGNGEKYDPGFNRKIEWDLSLLEGYNYEFLINTAKIPGSHHFCGIINPEIGLKIIEFKPSAILVYGWAYASHLKVLRQFKGKIPIWFRGDSTLLDSKKDLKNKVRNIFLRWVYHHIDLAFFVGTANKNYFKSFGLNTDQLIYAPHTVDNDRFANDKTNEAKLLRTSLSIHHEDILILFAGKLETKKNPELLLQAFIEMITESDGQSRELSAKNKDYSTRNNDNLQPQVLSAEAEKTYPEKQKLHLLFVGNGLLELKLKEYAKNASEKNIHFLDFKNQSEMPSIYQAADLFCLPSKGPGETWGLAINEAMAANCAILTSDKVGSSIDLVKDCVNGYVFNAGSLNQLKTMLNKLMNKKLLKDMGLKSGKIISNFKIETQVNALLSTLNRTENN